MTSNGHEAKRAIIFGGSGFIGSHLARSLADAAVDVTIADISRPRQLPDGVRYEFCDVRRPITVAHATPFDLVYNLAAVHRTPGHEAHEYYETNIAGAQNIANWCEQGGETRLTFTSSISVYGPDDAPKDEAAELTPVSDYGYSKLFAERVFSTWVNASGERKLTVVRPAVVFGPGEQGNFTRLAQALRQRRFVYVGTKAVVKACGYVDDLVHAMRFMETRDERRTVFNFCYEDRYTIEDICNAFADVAGYRLPARLPQPIATSAISTLKVLNPRDRGLLAASRVKKLTASTNIVPNELAHSGFKWRTDLEGGLRDWMDRSGGAFV